MSGSGVRIGASIAWILLLVGATVPGTGCGTPDRTQSGQETVYSVDFRSISVPAFANSTPDRMIAPNITEALIKEIQTFTPWKVTGPGRADTIFRGTVTNYRLVLLSKDPTTGLANEMMVEATISFDWVDLRTGEPILSRRAFSASALFTPSRPLQQPIDLGRFQVAQTMAREIVDTLQADW
ncbi:MAG: LPS assembly lipoprotein LptE [Planctomycetota bacterium]|nr:LPS assembly lipoprotein LptE [Planctomycetota bacterium]